MAQARGAHHETAEQSEHEAELRRARAVELAISHYQPNPGTNVKTVLEFARAVDRYIDSGEVPE